MPDTRPTSIGSARALPTCANIGSCIFTRITTKSRSRPACVFGLCPYRTTAGPPAGFVSTAPIGRGYATDLGTWQSSLAEALANVDILALEFNHDVAMEKSSGRDPQLIARVLGDAGHLSNEQAAALVREVLLRSQPNRMRHLVQLHMSRQCNRPTLARAVAERVLRRT